MVMAGKRRRPSRSNRRGMVAIAAVVMVLLVGLLVQSQKLSAQNVKYAEKKANLEQQIKDEEMRADDIENMKDYIDSPEYIEKIARDKLGLVYKDEILFKAEGLGYCEAVSSFLYRLLCYGCFVWPVFATAALF